MASRVRINKVFEGIFAAVQTHRQKSSEKSDDFKQARRIPSEFEKNNDVFQGKSNKSRTTVNHKINVERFC